MSVWWGIQLLSPSLLCLPQVVIVLDAKSCLTLASLLGSSVHGISQARILERPFPSPGHLPDLGVKPYSPALVGGFFTSELPGKPACSRTGQ